VLAGSSSQAIPATLAGARVKVIEVEELQKAVEELREQIEEMQR